LRSSYALPGNTEKNDYRSQPSSFDRSKANRSGLFRVGSDVKNLQASQPCRLGNMRGGNWNFLKIEARLASEPPNIRFVASAEFN
jgi:hypothetical protein